jgi:predicted enzyme related to lactoylglutathione lyase
LPLRAGVPFDHAARDRLRRVRRRRPRGGEGFYAKALGWTFNDYGPDYAGIQDPTRPGQEFGGLNPRPATSRGDGVVALARTDDADASLASVLAAGGRATVELNEYPGGRRFMFADPWGNVLGIYEPSE